MTDKHVKQLPAHQLFKALGHPIRMLIIWIMLDGQPFTKNQIYDTIGTLVPQTTRDQIDRQLRMLEKYSVVEKVPSPRKNEPGRAPYSYRLSEASRAFYKKLVDALNLAVGNNRHHTAKQGPKVIALLDKIETGLYFSGPREASLIKSSLKGLSEVLSLVEISHRRKLVGTLPFSCEEAQGLIRSPMFKSLLHKIARERLERILLSESIYSPEDGEKIISGQCSCNGCEELTVRVVQAILNYLVLVEKIENSVINVLRLEVVAYNMQRP